MSRTPSITDRASLCSREGATPSRRNSITSFFSLRPEDGEGSSGKRVVVYDTLEKRIYMENPDNIRKKKFVKVAVPGQKMMIDLKAPIGPKGNEVEMKVGTINLDTLRKTARRKRQNGLIQHVYILGQLPGGFGNIDEVLEE